MSVVAVVVSGLIAGSAVAARALPADTACHRVGSNKQLCVLYTPDATENRLLTATSDQTGVAVTQYSFGRRYTGVFVQHATLGEARVFEGTQTGARITTNLVRAAAGTPGAPPADGGTGSGSFFVVPEIDALPTVSGRFDSDECAIYIDGQITQCPVPIHSVPAPPVIPHLALP